jgi:hypothetical protein
MGSKREDFPQNRSRNVKINKEENDYEEPIAKLFFRVGSKIRLSSTIPIF